MMDRDTVRNMYVVESYFKNKFEKLMLLVGFIIRILDCCLCNPCPRLYHTYSECTVDCPVSVLSVPDRTSLMTKDEGGK